MPYKSECEELLDNSIIIDEELFGTSGKRVIGPNGNSIFIPKSGGEDYSGIAYYKNECVHMWTGNCTNKENRNAWSLLLSNMQGKHIYDYDQKIDIVLGLLQEMKIINHESIIRRLFVMGSALSKAKLLILPNHIVSLFLQYMITVLTKFLLRLILIHKEFLKFGSPQIQTCGLKRMVMR